MTVDDEPIVLSAVARDLRSRYSEEYNVVDFPGGGRPWRGCGNFNSRVTALH